MSGIFKIHWFDGKRSPQHPPNPEYPDGMDLDVSGGSSMACSTPLSYPAPRIGHYIVQCQLCEMRVVVTTAGRPDDPRSVRMACKTRLEA